MKNLVIFLAILCALLAAGWFNRNRTAYRQEEASQTTLQTLSNQVAAVQTRLVLAQAQASDAQGVLQQRLTRCMTELGSLSNRLAHTTAALSAAQKELATARTDGAVRTAGLEELSAQAADLSRQVDRLKPFEPQLAAARRELAMMTRERAVAVQECGRLQLEKAELLRKTEDPDFLRAQSAKVEQERKTWKALAEKRPASVLARVARLELLPDDTVRLATNDLAAAKSGK